MKKTLLTLVLTVAATVPALAQVSEAAKPAPSVTTTTPTAAVTSTPVKHVHGKRHGHKKAAHKDRAKADAPKGAAASPAAPATGK